MGIVESASAYNFSQFNFSEQNIVERVLEFAVIYFSKDKCNKLIARLEDTTNAEARVHLENQRKIIKLRTNVSIKRVKNMIALSSTIREIFELALKALHEIELAYVQKSKSKGTISMEKKSLSKILKRPNSKTSKKKEHGNYVHAMIDIPDKISPKQDLQFNCTNTLSITECSMKRVKMLIAKTEELLEP